MKTVYKCEKCGMVFEDYDRAEYHENWHYNVKTWFDATDERTVNCETEYSPELAFPSAVVVPMNRSYRDDETGEWKTETLYMKYYYAGKKTGEAISPVSEPDNE